MFDRNHRATLARLADMVILASFIGLSAFAYDEFFVGAGQLMTASSRMEFADFYRPGENPWAGAMIEPAEPGGRFASLAPSHRAYR